MTRRVGVERIEQAVNKVKCVWCLNGIVALDRRDVVKLLRRELDKRDARVRRIVTAEIAKRETFEMSVSWNKGYITACLNLRDALSGRKGKP